MDRALETPSLVPPLADYPPDPVRSSLPPVEWQACLDSWLFSLELRLKFNAENFSKAMSSYAFDMKFLTSYCQTHQGISNMPSDPKEAHLHRWTYLLCKRILLSTNFSHESSLEKLIDYLLLANQTFHLLSDWRATLRALFIRDESRFSLALESWKSLTMKRFDAPQADPKLSMDLTRMNSLVQVFPEAGLILMTGSDYLESLMGSYHKNTLLSHNQESTQHLLTEHLYRGLRSLMSDQMKNISLLLDHLYLLNTETSEKQRVVKSQEGTIFSSLLCTTAFVRQFSRDTSVVDTNRGRGLVDTLIAARQQARHLHPLPVRRRKVSKGKAKAKDENHFSVHKAAQVFQIQDLFPNCSNVYILRLLDHYEGNTEQVIAALLEPDSLPENLKDVDNGGNTPIDHIERQLYLAPQSTPPFLPTRRNVFDNDEFDELRVSSKQIHRGRKDMADDEPATKDEHARSKAAIMAALAAFDSDDDERDDTYDVADVGGSVDQSVDTDSRARAERPPDQDAHEETLFRAWKSNVALFGRDSKTRISPARQDLKRQTGLSDEQLEGWAIVLGRDKVLQGRLERKYLRTAMFTNSQSALRQTKWQQTSSHEPSADEDEGEALESTADGRRLGQAQIRGARNWNRGRGGSTSGPGNDAATQAARRRKEQGPGRGGAQSRREGRAKKIGRGMGGPPV